MSFHRTAPTVPPSDSPLVGDMTRRLKILRELLVSTDNVVAIIFYDSLRNDYVMKELKCFNPELLIVDEMHYLKSHTTGRNKRVRGDKTESQVLPGADWYTYTEEPP